MCPSCAGSNAIPVMLRLQLGPQFIYCAQTTNQICNSCMFSTSTVHKLQTKSATQACFSPPAVQPSERQQQLSTAIVQDTISALPVRPDYITDVRGPMLEVSRASDAAMDLRVVHSFRAHFPGRSVEQLPPASALPSCTIVEQQSSTSGSPPSSGEGNVAEPEQAMGGAAWQGGAAAGGSRQSSGRLASVPSVAAAGPYSGRFQVAGSFRQPQFNVVNAPSKPTSSLEHVGDCERTAAHSAAHLSELASTAMASPQPHHLSTTSGAARPAASSSYFPLACSESMANAASAASRSMMDAEVAPSDLAEGIKNLLHRHKKSSNTPSYGSLSLDPHTAVVGGASSSSEASTEGMESLRSGSKAAHNHFEALRGVATSPVIEEYLPGSDGTGGPAARTYAGSPLVVQPESSPSVQQLIQAYKARSADAKQAALPRVRSSASMHPQDGQQVSQASPRQQQQPSPQPHSRAAARGDHKDASSSAQADQRLILSPSRAYQQQLPDLHAAPLIEHTTSIPFPGDSPSGFQKNNQVRLLCNATSVNFPKQAVECIHARRFNSLLTISQKR